jgi:hypothetical protein
MPSGIGNKDPLLNKSHFLRSEILDNSLLPNGSSFYGKSNLSGNLGGSAFYEENPSF